MLENFIAKFGFGAAKVDLQLDYFTYKQGDIIEGKIIIQGGQAEQDIDGIYVFLTSKDNNSKTDIVSSIFINDPFNIKNDEQKEILFSLQLDNDIKPSISGELGYYFKTGLDIQNSVDPQDIDYINIEVKDFQNNEIIPITKTI
jgi:sporulation-control protein